MSTIFFSKVIHFGLLRGPVGETEGLSCCAFIISIITPELEMLQKYEKNTKNIEYSNILFNL